MKKELNNSIDSFLDWFNGYGELSYDRMDYWSSKTGVLAKKIFYKNKALGFPLALWGLVLENFLPSIQKKYSSPHREVIGDAHFALSYFNLFEINNDPSFLSRGEHFLDIMLQTSSKGYSGYSWGYTFGWQHSRDDYWEPGIPLITITPYAFWAFKKHYEITGNESSKRVALSIAEFAFNDLKQTKMPNGTMCSSYSPIKEDVVINANTYRAAVLIEAFDLCNNLDYKIEAEKNIEFVLSYQGDFGEWYYEAKEPKNNFIDNFHTCFILRNLYKCYLINKDEDLLEAINKGYNYYINNLFYSDGRPKHFSIAKYAKLRKYEMYDYAEGITLGVLLKDTIDKALDKSIFLADDLIQNFQTDKGYFITRVTSFGTRHKVPYLRWPQAQLLHALTTLYKELK